LPKAFINNATNFFGTCCSSAGDSASEAPGVPGRIDDQPFEWLADADTRLGPMLEAVVNGRYYWIPMHRLREIRLEKPVDLRDLVWTAAYLTWGNGGQSAALIPTRYPGSEGAEDSRLIMARATEWLERPAGQYEGIGQRLLATDRGEYALMDIRTVALDVADSGSEEDVESPVSGAEAARPAGD
jgi:type VI secretion system protein ImpE